MTDTEKFLLCGCGIDSFCKHSAGHHACCHMANHPDNKSCPQICVDGSYFELNPYIDKNIVNEYLSEGWKSL